MGGRARRRALIGANLVGIAVLATSGGWDILQIYTGVGLPVRTSREPLELVAHRGDLDHFPENTLEAIAAAARLPVDGIEFDSVQSADGTWWVIHDPTLDRTTTGAGWIPGLTDEEIARARVDGGFGFDVHRHDDIFVPRLSAVLDALRDYQGKIYVDIQHAPTGDVASVVEMLRGRNAAVLCRDLADTRTVKERDPAIETYLRLEDGPSDDSVDGWLMESHFEADVGALESSALPVVTFVEEWLAGLGETGLIRRAWAIGVTAFLTKHPSEAIAVRSNLIAESSRP